MSQNAEDAEKNLPPLANELTVEDSQENDDESLSMAELIALANLSDKSSEGDNSPSDEDNESDPATYARRTLENFRKDAEDAELAERFRVAQANVRRLRQQYRNGTLSREQLQAELRTQMVLDENQVWWMLGVETDTWYRYENNEWKPGIHWAIPPSPPLVRIGSWRGAGNDRVAKEDQLEFKHYVNAFADLIEAEGTTPPLTIGIYGAWGAGKSFLLNAIQTELDARYAKREKLPEDERKKLRVVSRVHAVSFNAWEYNATEVIWAGLVRKIMDSLVKKLRFGSLGLRIKRVNYNLHRQWKLSQGRLFGQVLLWFVLAAALVIVVTVLGGSSGLDFGEIAVRIFGVGSVFVVFNLLRDVIASPASQWITALFEEGNYGHQIGYMADIHSDLSFLDKRLKDKGERVLITIDDLDRCEPRKAVEVLQAINLLLNFDSFIVILGIDARIITGAISKYYSNLLEGAGASGYEYLDKIIQIPFRIPQPNEDEIRAFLSKQLTLPGSLRLGFRKPLPLTPPTDATSRHATLPAIPVFDSHYARQDAAFGYDELRAFHDLAPMLRANPRHLKRMVNIYRLVRSLAEYRSNDPVILENPNATVRWLVLAAQWSYTSSVMLRCYDELCEKHSRDQVIEACGADDPLEWLYGKAKPLLKKDLADKLDDDLDQLAKLLKKGRGQIDWRTLDSLRRYTINFNPAVESESVSTEALKLFEDDLPEIILPPE